MVYKIHHYNHNIERKNIVVNHTVLFGQENCGTGRTGDATVPYVGALSAWVTRAFQP